MRLTPELAAMAEAARPKSDEDYASDRQTEAFNAFCEAAAFLMTEQEHDEWDAYSAKATNDEMIDKALELLKTSLFKKIDLPVIRQASDDAVQGLIAALQAKMSVTSGDAAGQFFTGRNADRLTDVVNALADLMSDYVKHEVTMNQ